MYYYYSLDLTLLFFRFLFSNFNSLNTIAIRPSVSLCPERRLLMEQKLPMEIEYQQSILGSKHSIFIPLYTSRLSSLQIVIFHTSIPFFFTAFFDFFLNTATIVSNTFFIYVVIVLFYIS